VLSHLPKPDAGSAERDTAPTEAHADGYSAADRHQYQYAQADRDQHAAPNGNEYTAANRDQDARAAYANTYAN
jgi:hypothetical protein